MAGVKYCDEPPFSTEHEMFLHRGIVSFYDITISITITISSLQHHEQHKSSIHLIHLFPCKPLPIQSLVVQHNLSPSPSAPPAFPSPYLVTGLSPVL
jgi:hypothetical protein